MLIVLLKTIHYIACILLTLVVLIQQGKNSDMASAFGGSGASPVFGAAGGQNFLQKLTTALAACFMTTSLILGIFLTDGARSIMVDQPAGLAQPVSGQEVPMGDLGTEGSAPVGEVTMIQIPAEAAPGAESAPEAPAESAPVSEAPAEAAPVAEAPAEAAPAEDAPAAE